MAMAVAMLPRMMAEMVTKKVRFLPKWSERLPMIGAPKRSAKGNEALRRPKR